MQLLQCDTRCSTASISSLSRVPFRGKDHVVVTSQSEAHLGPFIKVPTHSHRPPDTLLLPDRPILLKGPRPFNRRLVDPRALEDLVRPLLKGEVSLGRPRLVRSQVAVGLDHVVLDQGVLGPAIHGEVARAGRLVRSCVGDDPSAASAPPFAADETARA